MITCSDNGAGVSSFFLCGENEMNSKSDSINHGLRGYTTLLGVINEALRSHVLGWALVLVYVTGPGFDFSLCLYHLWLQPGLGWGRGIAFSP